MRIIFFFIALVAFQSCAVQKFFIVRHAEKETAVMAGDPPLSATGIKQAQELAAALRNKKISYIYSSNFKRTLATAEPLSKALGLPIRVYQAGKELDLIREMVLLKGNFLIVGHANTVDDLVNGLTGKKILSDLPDTEYGYIYLVTKKGTKSTYEKIAFTKSVPEN